MINLTVRERIFQQKEDNYKKFQSNLIPGENRILGVRIPYLRSLAKEIAKEDWREYLKNGEEEYFEEIMLKGLIIGYAKADLPELLLHTADFIPKINNWAVCDSFCTGLKFAKKYPAEVWNFILPYFDSQKEFDIRFGVIMLLSHFINENKMDEIILLLDKISHDGYYVKMGVAWAISVCYVKHPEKTMAYLKNNHLDDFTYNKSLQKIIDSYRVNDSSKEIIRAMKQKNK